MDPGGGVDVDDEAGEAHQRVFAAHLRRWDRVWAAGADGPVDAGGVAVGQDSSPLGVSVIYAGAREPGR